MKEIAVKICGWYGAVALLVAFGLVSFSVLKPDQLLYQVLNLTGALGIVIVSLYRKAYPPGVLNLIWAIVACGSIIRLIL